MTTYGKGAANIHATLLFFKPGLGPGPSGPAQPIRYKGREFRAVEIPGPMTDEQMGLIKPSLPEFFGMKRYRNQHINLFGVPILSEGGVEKFPEGPGQVDLMMIFETVHHP